MQLLLYSSLSFDRQSFDQSKDYFALRKIQVPYSMAIANEKLLHKRVLKHSRLGTARMKSDKATEEGGKKRRVNREGEE